MVGLDKSRITNQEKLLILLNYHNAYIYEDWDELSCEYLIFLCDIVSNIHSTEIEINKFHQEYLQKEKEIKGKEIIRKAWLF